MISDVKNWGLAMFLLTAIVGCGDDSSGTAGSGATGGNGGIGGGAAGTSGTGGSLPVSQAERPADYIRNQGFHTLKIELDTESGLSPRSGVADMFLSALGNVLDKPNGISIVTDETDLAPADDGVWTFAELQALADEHFGGIPDEDGVITFHTMWLGDQYQNPNVLGVAWDNRYLVIFGDRIDDFCSGLPLLSAQKCALAQATIWTHESGHIIGLVDNGVAMVNDHKDPDHGAHDVSDQSVMYWAYDGSVNFGDFVGGLGGSSVIAWGTECEADLAAVRDGN
ncbi:MAG: hypothetical protein R3A47_06250 [Polyangiales bacterium]